ncbi:MAG: hypothetical protein K2Y39_13110 [Candidatus Obscuribacterales bacterium]|nr:hypothetical protein [Candidatus Obscuribacterales bacterium]
MLNSVASITTFAAPKFKQLRPESGIAKEQAMPDGTTINTDSEGEIVFVEYASGIKVKRNPGFTMVSMQDGSYMVGAPSFSWLRID